jgi:hypothetical protein
VAKLRPATTSPARASYYTAAEAYAARNPRGQAALLPEELRHTVEELERAVTELAAGGA